MLGAVAVLALALAPACRNTAEGVKEDTRENAEKVKEESREARDASKDTADKIGDQAKETGDKIVEGAKDVGQAIKEGAKEVGSEIHAKKQTVDVKTALMADTSIDASHIDVDTNADTKTVTLKGTVPSAAQKAAAERVAREHAEGYTVRNQLTVARSS
jgi:osmotically-inducible protein OsmY